jgi:hypothetical protein
MKNINGHLMRSYPVADKRQAVRILLDFGAGIGGAKTRARKAIKSMRCLGLSVEEVGSVLEEYGWSELKKEVR